MNRRVQKVAKGFGESKTLRHLVKHLHVTNCIHIRNHVHMQQKRSLMLDCRKTPHELPLVLRELTAVKKVKALQDPPATSYSSPDTFSANTLSKTRMNSGENGGPGARTDGVHPHLFEQSTAWRNRAARGSEGNGHSRRTGEALEEGVQQKLGFQNGGSYAKANLRRNESTDCYGVRSKKSTPYHTVWPGDTEEVAPLRSVFRENGHLQSPHSYQPYSSQGHSVSPSWVRDQGLHQTARETARASAAHMMTPEFRLMCSEPTKYTRSCTATRRVPDTKKPKEEMNLPVGLHSRAGRIHNQRVAHTTGHRESVEAPVVINGLEMSEIVQQGCGRPWYQSRTQKYKGKMLLDFSGMGFTCTFPESMKRKGNSKHVSRNGSQSRSRLGSIQHPESAVAAAGNPARADQSTLLSSDFSSEGAPLVNRKEFLFNGEDANYSHDDKINTPGHSGIEKSPSTACDQVSDRGSPLVIARAGNQQKDFQASRAPSEQCDSVGNMPYQSLSQKYGPKCFSDLIGQTLVVKSLSTAITKGKIAPVYLFAGPHGTGKTSAARIFAAALICHNTEPHRRPCGLCRECTTLILNRSSNVKEIDAARNLEQDSMRNVLHRMTTFPPSNSCYKVFIVEGCEALNPEVWDTLLKFLDDMPLRNVVFILITTDLDRLPLMATSRCMKLPFGKLKEVEIVAQLQFLASKEALEVDEAAIALIAARANGSLHDAELTLDQLSLLDRKVSVAMVQELVGLVSDQKLLDLLDLALSADAENTVRCLRELLDSGVDALSLVTQLASLITNILAGTFDIHREMHKKGFFKRNFSKKEEQRCLRQALKVLAESEKQLRISNDRLTWLTVALLQFAPDRSYLPSSVDTSMTPSPIAFDTLEKTTAAEAYTPRIQTSAEQIHVDNLQKAQSSHAVLTPKSPSTAIVDEHLKEDKRAIQLCNAHSEGGKKMLPSSGNHSETKVYPAESPVEKAGECTLVVTTSQPGSIVASDGAGLTCDSCEFLVLASKEMEEVWMKVIQQCRLHLLKQLLQAHGSLISVCIAKDNSCAVSHVEFQHLEHQARAERLRSSTCHAFQMVLGCAVELKLSLASPTATVITEEANSLQVLESRADSQPGSSSDTSPHSNKLKAPGVQEAANSTCLSALQLPETLLHDRKPMLIKNQQQLEALIGHSCENPDGFEECQMSNESHGYDLTRMENPNEEAPQDMAEALTWQKLGGKTSHEMSTLPQPNALLDKFDENCALSSKQNRAAKQKQLELENIIAVQQETLMFPSRTKSSRRSLCWNSSPSQKLKGKTHHWRSRRRAAFFLRLVPCTKSRLN